MLIVIGASLTLAPVVYVALERLIFVKVAAVLTLAILASFLAIDATSWRALPSGLVNVGYFPPELSFALLFGAMVFAGAGGGQNLCQSNWIRDKGFGMGKYVPRLVSPITGTPQAAETGTLYRFEPTPETWRVGAAGGASPTSSSAPSFVLVTVATIALTSMLAHATLFGRPSLPNGVAFLEIEGNELAARAGNWFKLLFWATGAFSLFGSAMGIIDYTSRLAADILKSTYLTRSTVSESRLYFGLVWGLVAIGVTILLVGATQPIVLLVISASVGGLMMFVYSGLAHRDQSPRPARADPRAVVSPRVSRVGDGALRAAGVDHDLGATRPAGHVDQ